MKTTSFVLALVLLGVANAQRGGRRQAPRRGRDGTGYSAPADDGYASPSEPQPAYAGAQDQYQASDSGDDNLAMLEKAVPGIPGEDYPIYAEAPETGFACDGQVDGGYYADPEAEGLYSLNDELAAEREAASSNAQASYASPDSEPIGGYDAPSDVAEAAQAAYQQAARNARNGRGPSQPFNQ